MNAEDNQSSESTRKTRTDIIDLFQQEQEDFEKSPERMAFVAKIKKAVKTGKYNPDIKDVARKLLKELHLLK